MILIKPIYENSAYYFYSVQYIMNPFFKQSKYGMPAWAIQSNIRH